MPYHPTNTQPLLSRRSLIMAGALVLGPFRPAFAFEEQIHQAAPGDVVVLDDAVVEGDVKIRLEGKPDKPLTVMAKNMLGVTIKGTLEVDGRHYILEGIKTEGGGFIINGRHGTVRHCMAQNGRGIGFFLNEGRDHLLEYSTVQNWHGRGIVARGTMKRPHIRRCYLYRSTARENGTEAIQIGRGLWDSKRTPHALVEECRIEEWNSDHEAISVKSSNNTLRRITVENSTGRVQNRHGENNLFEALWLKSSGSLRIFDRNNRVINCKTELSLKTGLEIAAGSVTSDQLSHDGRDAGHPHADQTLVTGCDCDTTVIGALEKGYNLPAMKTVLRQHQGPIVMSLEEESDIDPEGLGETQSALSPLFLQAGDVGPQAG